MPKALAAPSASPTPDLGLGYAYAPNQMNFHLVDDPHEQTPGTAADRCLGTQPRTPRRNG